MTTFENLGLAPELVRAVSELGFETPTPIQAQSIPMLLEGNTDLVALAQTGTGKTAAFGLPLLHLINPNSRKIQALILSPTRELCLQITRDLEEYGKYTKGFKTVAVYGGASIGTQLKAIEDGVQIVVATPGRLVDIMNRKKRSLEEVEYVVLDEADEMLNMGFKEDLDIILSYTPETKNTWLFSATMPNEVLRISRNYMKNPREISSGERNTANQNIEHIYYVVHARDKYMALKRIADYHPDIFAIVFCRTKIETQQIADMLVKDGYNADALHGDLSQAQRDVVMKRYRNRNLQLLVATDVAARGIDVDDVTHVINYSLPDEPESYTHRSGRTARAGKKGISMALINMREIGRIKTQEKVSKIQFTRAQLPDGNAVCEQQLLSLVKKVHNVSVNRAEIEPFLPAIYEELSELSREEIITRFISVEFNRFLEYYRNSPDLNAYGNNDEQGSGGVKMFLTLGSLDGLNKQSIREFVAKTAGIEESAIPWIDIKNSYSFVEVQPNFVDKVLAAFKGVTYQGRKAEIELREKSGRGNRDRKDKRERSGRSRDDRFEKRGRSDFRSDRGSNGNRGSSSNKSRPFQKNDRTSSGERNYKSQAPVSAENVAPKKKKHEMTHEQWDKNFDLSKELKSIFEMDKSELRKLEKKRKGN